VKPRGFTLIEVLVALAIVVLGIAALLSSLTSAADTTIFLRDKTFAQWIALNRIAEVRLKGPQLPAKGKTNGEIEVFAGRERAPGGHRRDGARQLVRDRERRDGRCDRLQMGPGRSLEQGQRPHGADPARESTLMSRVTVKITGGRHWRSGGFTIIELLIALFITAILFAMGYGAINQAVNNSGALEEQQARLLAVQTAMRMFAQDLGQLAPRPVREPIGSDWLAALVAQAPASSPTYATPLLSFTRTGWANPAGVQRPALQRVSYSFEKDTLRREYLPVLDATLANQTTKRDLLTGVRSVTFRYLNQAHQWVDHWPEPPAPANDPEAAQRSRPFAVELTLELEDWGRIVRLFEIPQ
jgi:general secretion pathway protein J